MISKIPVSVRVGGCALAAVSAVSLALAGCAQAAKPTAAKSQPTSRPGTTAPAKPPAKPANLVADAGLRQKLQAVFTAFRSDAANTPGYAAIPPSAVGGIAPKTLYYAFNPATGTYWATASFYATKAASQTQEFVGFQDGGNQAVFMRAAGRSWQVESVGPCLAGLPVPVAATWTLIQSQSGMCPNGVPAG